MSDKKNNKLINFGKRDESIWNALNEIPKGDQSFHVKQALRLYFFGEQVETPKLQPVPEPIQEAPSPIKLDAIRSMIK